ncbi:MAG: LOG family protein [Parcubacteria group bacterium]
METNEKVETSNLQKVSFEQIEKAFMEFKEKANNPYYVAIFGKTFLDETTDEYKLTKEVARKVIENDLGVIHGAYTGVMKAASQGADAAIQKSNKSEYLNIGVPMKTFDEELPKASRINLPAAETIGDRKKALIEFCDVCVVMPSGGFGTMLESLEIFHMNQLAEKFGGKVRPLIFVGERWNIIFKALYDNLDMNKQKTGESFCHFIKNIEQLELILNEIELKKEI